ncbi:WbuC family cupin fold metalloprotein [Sulfurivermis fontis]|jgi:cupin fold WbuC family metalloprotein|uniref:WbuC family cupin fold metalloprotein n=1 Tax=Sulfurivermis fontis TaxID=1972068 RepID=UPI000FDC3020|nr:WbuC family cupin fold metalloprotein [Sulfurivermis fontis]
MKPITTSLMHELSHRAVVSVRGRSNFNLHPQLSDPVQRFLNAIEPGSYVRPHRHGNPPRWELFVVRHGAAVILLLDDDGVVDERVELDTGGAVRAAEIPAGVWHTVVARAPGTVLFEFKEGPYAPLSDKDFAAWAPTEGDPMCPHWVRRFLAAMPGSRLADYR